MTEKFFIITNKSEHCKEYYDYWENHKLVNKFVIDFMCKFGIQANEYRANNQEFWIVPAFNETQEVTEQLRKQPDHNLYMFKKKSVIGQAWLLDLKAAGLKIIRKPMVPFFFKGCCGKTSAGAFPFKEQVLLSIQTDCQLNTPDGFVEIKGSEFYKALEEYEKKDEKE